MRDTFRKIAARISNWVGTPSAFALALLFIATWAIAGPFFNFSAEWQLIVNTGTTILTFLMVFLIQNTQNRDARAIHLKLDELIRSVRSARNSLIDAEDMGDDDMAQLKEEFRTFRERKLSEIRSKQKSHL